MWLQNDAELAIGSNQNQVTLVWPDGAVDALPLLPKDEVASMLIDRVSGLLAG